MTAPNKDRWLNRPISVLYPYLSKRSKRAVQSFPHVRTARDLMQVSPKEFRKLPNMSRKSVEEIHSILVARFGYGLNPIDRIMDAVAKINADVQMQAWEKEQARKVLFKELTDWSAFVGQDSTKETP